MTTHTLPTHTHSYDQDWFVSLVMKGKCHVTPWTLSLSKVLLSLQILFFCLLFLEPSSLYSISLVMSEHYQWCVWCSVFVSRCWCVCHACPPCAGVNRCLRSPSGSCYSSLPLSSSSPTKSSQHGNKSVSLQSLNISSTSQLIESIIYRHSNILKR